MAVPTDTTTFLALEARAEAALAQGAEAALAAAQAARQEAGLLADPLYAARADALLGAALLLRVAQQPAAELLARAELLCRERGDFTGLSRCLLHLGHLAKTRGDFQGASRHFLELLSLAQVHGSAHRLADAHNGLAIIFDDLGDVASSLEHQLEAIAALRALDDPPGLARLLANVSVDYRALGQSQEAERYCQDAIRQARRHGEHGAEIAARYNLGMAYLAQGRHAEAQATFEETVAQARAAGLLTYLSWGLRGLGKVHLAHEQPAAALEPLQEALALSQRSGQRAEEGDIWLMLGRAQPPAEAAQSLGRALTIALETANSEAEARTRRALAGVLEAAHDPQGALEQLKRYLALQDGREVRLLAQRAQVMAARFGTEEKERENRRLAAQARDLEQAAHQDALTGLANRRGLELHLRAALTRAEGGGEPLCLAMLDLDHFKQVNDRHSHRIGDEVLRACARLFERGCRAGDELARIGGEEFVLLLPDTGLAAAAAVLERLRLSVQAHPWNELAPGLAVTISVGLAEAVPGDSAEGLLASADARLYQAKHSGRDRVVWA